MNDARRDRIVNVRFYNDNDDQERPTLGLSPGSVIDLPPGYVLGPPFDAGTSPPVDPDDVWLTVGPRGLCIVGPPATVTMDDSRFDEATMRARRERGRKRASWSSSDAELWAPFRIAPDDMFAPAVLAHRPGVGWALLGLGHGGKHRYIVGVWNEALQPLPRRCGDCDVLPGDLHVPGCDVERCPICRQQAIACDHHGVPDSDRVPYDGDFPGRKEAALLGLFSKDATNQGGEMHAECAGDDPWASPGLNAYASMGSPSMEEILRVLPEKEPQEGVLPRGSKL